MELPKSYEPAKYEADIYKIWENSGAFKPSDDPKAKPFSIIMPPPNANGDLHTGHTMYVVEDIMARYHRMKGDSTLWLPGADHAGIETQVVFERVLAQEGKSRFDLGRELFYQEAYAFTRKNEANMTSQLRKLGFSVDWSRFKFTLDDDIIKTVYETFKQMHDDGLIYRGNRIVNWCPHCRSGFSELEIKYREQIDPLYYIKYGAFVLATVRPETKFGDTAIAVNPKDERYQHYIGQEIESEGLLGKFKLKVIADDYVDPAFGTGVVKVTPAHDPNDWEMGLRHNLEVKQAIGTDGLLTELTGKYAGMPVAEAREQVAHDLEERGLMDHIEMDYLHSVAYHDRCGTLIEPLVTEQWWLAVGEIKQRAIKAVKDGEIKFVPQRFEKIYLDWMNNLRDWNISRQNWFGIKIPVYYSTSSNVKGQMSGVKKPYIVALNEQEAIDYYGAGNYEAETDTFDTWFSSGQWPYATLLATGDFDRFYPTSVMATARDIIFLWVSRMVMFSYYRFDLPPFRTVYLWGMLNDAHGKKMSKSKGNVINPLEYTAEYGTDALRLAVTIGVTPGTGGSIGREKVEGYRNFCNKLWNVARYILAQVPATTGTDYSLPEVSNLNLADRWILHKVSQASASITTSIENYKFSEAGAAVYSLLWDDFADWYIEASKAELNLPVLIYGLETILKLAHPFAPFVTEAIWQNLAWKKENLITTPWPPKGPTYAKEAKQFEQVQNIVTELRVLSRELRVIKPELLYKDAEFKTLEPVIARLTGLGSSKQVEQGRGLALTTTSHEVWLDIPTDVIAGYLAKLESYKADKVRYIKQQDDLLANARFMASAPDQVKQQKLDSKTEAELLLSKLDAQIKAIQKSQI